MSNGLFEGITLKPHCTLWPFDCDVYEGHKLHKRRGTVLDSDGGEVLVCNDSSYILNSIKDEKDVLLACASR
ncbi:Magnesium-dependent phosphatase 1 [Fasciolopsis buskii]|uniref:Magnesium-dependent phosphatase 1 n=1 Tax=Fasciolopsis buskii TaxID=27845 RepID=A0A8E0VHS0_9TREM|nr:Magnesium-dependent phosphatase 1 [Fasciolopsis buski]KAA0188848.1 Magnesium-dependent phosphatase 1 [Fasciolopsis buski]